MLRWARIRQRAATYPTRLPAEPTSHRCVWEPFPSQRPVGISPCSPAAPDAALITLSRRKTGPPSAEEEQEKHPRTNQPYGHFQPIPGGLLAPSSSAPPACPTLPLPNVPTLFTRGELPLGVGPAILCRNGSPNPWEPERDAMQHWGRARDCQELQAATATSSQTRAEESTAPWWGDLASPPLPAPTWLWRRKLRPFPSIQHL